MRDRNCGTVAADFAIEDARRQLGFRNIPTINARFRTKKRPMAPSYSAGADR
jgi:hypothetical protein